MFFHTISFCDQSPLENHFALFVALVLFSCELIDPAELCVTVLAGDVPYHMSARKHHPVLDFTVTTNQLKTIQLKSSSKGLIELIVKRFGLPVI